MLWTAFISPAIWGGVIEVGPDSPWKDPLRAIEAARDGDTIIVHPGEYPLEEAIDFLGKRIAVRAPGGPEATILRRLAGPETAVAPVVVFARGETPASLLEGFTITGGTARHLVPRETSGGDARPFDGGGGISCSLSSPTIRNCIIEGNFDDSWGGGVALWESDAHLVECTIRYNGSMTGGGVYALGGSPRVTGSRIYGNSGSGIAREEGSDPRDLMILDRCVVAQNVSEIGGGLLLAGPMVARNCAFVANVAYEPVPGFGALGRGGAVYVSGAPEVAEFWNCDFVSNRAVLGAAIHPSEVFPTSASGLRLFNCIFWDTSDEEMEFEMKGCLVEVDPRFRRNGAFDFERYASVETPSGATLVPDFIVEEPDLHLLPDSPAIDAALREGAPTCDIDGEERPSGGGCDIGIDEYESRPARAFLRGDVRQDGRIMIDDMISSAMYIFLGGDYTPPCRKAADIDDDGRIALNDPIYGLLYLFAGGPRPAWPWPVCGWDDTIDDLDCVEYATCP